MAQRLAAKFADVRNVTPAELNTMIAEGEKVVIIDARTPEEYAVSHLPAAITLDQFEARRAQLEGSTIACYCTVGYRSSQLAGKLSKEGWNAANLQGSILAWVGATFMHLLAFHVAILAGCRATS